MPTSAVESRANASREALAAFLRASGVCSLLFSFIAVLPSLDPGQDNFAWLCTLQRLAAQNAGRVAVQVISPPAQAVSYCLAGVFQFVELKVGQCRYDLPCILCEFAPEVGKQYYRLHSGLVGA